jgi:hypothetical protein
MVRALMVWLLAIAPAAAQEELPAQSTITTQGETPAPPPPPPAPAPSTPPAPTQSTITPVQAPSTTTPPPSTPVKSSPFVTESQKSRWSHARNMYGFGSITGLVGTGLTISSLIVVGVTGYPCNPNDPIHQIDPKDTCNPKSGAFDKPSPTDAAPLLSYLGSSVSAFGFIFSAAGLGWQHAILLEANNDIPRGVFYGGTVLGVIGFVSTGVGYFFGLTDYLNPHDQGVAILATTVSATAFCAIGSLLYAIDASRTKRAWNEISF